MAQRGVHFALLPVDVEKLRQAENGEYPLRACILGGEQLYDGDDFVVSLLTPAQVVDVAAADGTPSPHDDFEYLWTCFRGLPEFFGKAAADGRAMVFTVDL